MNDAAGLHVSVALCKHRGPVNAVIWNSLSFFLYSTDVVHMLHRQARASTA